MRSGSSIFEDIFSVDGVAAHFNGTDGTDASSHRVLEFPYHRVV